MSTALANAYRKALEMQGRRVLNVVLPLPPVCNGIGRRSAVDAPLNVPPITILRPVPDDTQTVREFVRVEFLEASRKRESV